MAFSKMAEGNSPNVHGELSIHVMQSDTQNWFHDATWPQVNSIACTLWYMGSDFVYIHEYDRQQKSSMSAGCLSKVVLGYDGLERHSVGQRAV